MINTLLELFNSNIKINHKYDEKLPCIAEYMDFDNAPKSLLKQRNAIQNRISKFTNKFYDADSSRRGDDLYNNSEYMALQEKLDNLDFEMPTREGLYNVVSVEEICDLFPDIKKLESYDAYGSGLYSHKDTVFYMFDDYGDSDRDRNPFRIFTPFIVIKKTDEIQIADIVYNKDLKTFYIENHATGIFPLALKKFKIKTFTGKRTFYYNPDKNNIVMRCPEYLYDSKKMPVKYKAGERYRGNVSGTRIKLKVASVLTI